MGGAVRIIRPDLTAKDLRAAAGREKNGSAARRMLALALVPVINTNLGSLFNMTRQVIEGMRARKFGRVINISSVNGQKGQFGQVNYSAAKAGGLPPRAKLCQSFGNWGT